MSVLTYSANSRHPPPRARGPIGGAHRVECHIRKLLEETLVRIFWLAYLQQTTATRARPAHLDRNYLPGIESGMHDLTTSFQSRAEDVQPPIPLLVSQVCRDWKAIAESAAVLWSQITFDEQTTLPLRRRSIALYLARSQRHVLDIHLDLKSFFGSRVRPICAAPTSDELHDIFKRLVQHSMRWRSFRLFLPNKSTMAGVLLELERVHVLPSLEVLDIRGVDLQLGRFEGAVFRHVTHSNHQPPLVTIGCRLDLFQPSLLRQTTSLTICFGVLPQWATLRDVLSHSSTLRALTYEGTPYQEIRASAWHPDHPEERVIFIPGLSHLSLRDVSADLALDLIRAMSSPALSSLYLSLAFEHIFARVPTAIARHLRKSGKLGQLRRLGMCDSVFRFRDKMERRKFLVAGRKARVQCRAYYGLPWVSLPPPDELAPYWRVPICLEGTYDLDETMLMQ